MAPAMICNGVIFIATAATMALYFRRDGKWDAAAGKSAFRYFTVLSNALCALSSLAMLICELRGGITPAVRMFKFLGTASVTVTLLTVLLFLGPTQGGYAALFARDGLYMHLIGPLLAILSFCFFEKGGMPLARMLWGVAPVAVYGAVYLYRVVLAPEDRRWEDFYGFNRGGRWPVSLAMMLAGAAGVCVLLWAL